MSLPSFVFVDMIVLVFFFSSRRRHTRCLSDWSSDVCSSDLRLVAPPGDALKRAAIQLFVAARHDDWRSRAVAEVRLRERVRDLLAAPGDDENRSEERRVGKECRYRLWRHQ